MTKLMLLWLSPLVIIAIIAFLGIKGVIKGEEPTLSYVKPLVISEWELFYEALVLVESEGNPNSIGNNNAVGVLQITPIYVKDVNRIIGENKYTLNCRFSEAKSRQMFDIIQNHYNPTKSLKIAIKRHNPRSSKRYSEKIFFVKDTLKLNYIKNGYTVVD